MPDGRLIVPPLTSGALPRLLQLASPMLPVGGYSYSQGLETAIEKRWVHDAVSAATWIGDVLTQYLARFDLPLLCRMYEAWHSEEPALDRWNTFYCAGRDTRESQDESLQMGYSLARLLREMGGVSAIHVTRLEAVRPITYPLAHSCAATAWGISVSDMMQAYAWSWLENQVAAAMKAVPIGQTAAQRILFDLGQRLPAVIEAARALPDEEISNFAPGLSLAGCAHEIQHTRLFRS